MRVEIDNDVCQGHLRCFALAPDLFDSDDNGHGIVLVGELADDEVEAARRAVEACPEQAIRIEE